MNGTRRGVLLLSGTLLSGPPLTGCISSQPRNRTQTEPAAGGEPLDYQAATIHVPSSEGGAIEGGIGDAHDPKAYSGILFRTREAASQIRRTVLEQHNRDALELVDDTDFDRAVLLGSEQQLPGSPYRLMADAAVRTDDDQVHGIATVETVAQGGDAEEYLDTVLMRIAVAPAAIQEEALITIRDPPYTDEAKVTFKTS